MIFNGSYEYNKSSQQGCQNRRSALVLSPLLAGVMCLENW